MIITCVIFLFNALCFELSYWLLLGLYQGIVQGHIQDHDRRQFNQGICRSLQNGVLLSLVSASIITVMPLLSWMLAFLISYGLSGISYELASGLVDDLVPHGSIYIISGFFIIWAMSGGLTILRHYVIRWLLARSHRFPWPAQAFLDDATARILLQRVGGGYRFMHRLLLDYFADLETSPPSATSPISPPMEQPPSP